MISISSSNTKLDLSLKQKTITSDLKPKLVDVTTKYLSTTKGIKYMLLYPTDLSIRWAKWINPGLAPKWDAIQMQSRLSQKIFSVASLPVACQKFVKRCQNVELVFKEKRPASEIAVSAVKAGIGAALIAKPVASLLFLGDKSKIMPLSSTGISTLKVAGGIGSAGLAGESLYHVISDTSRLVQNKEKNPLFTVGMIIKNLSLLGIGITVLLSLLSPLYFASVLLLFCSTINLVLTLVLHFAEQMNPGVFDRVLEPSKKR